MFIVAALAAVLLGLGGADGANLAKMFGRKKTSGGGGARQVPAKPRAEPPPAKSTVGAEQLSRLRVSELFRRARADAGLNAGAIEEAMDSDDPKAEFIKLLSGPPSSRSGTAAAAGSQEPGGENSCTEGNTCAEDVQPPPPILPPPRPPPPPAPPLAEGLSADDYPCNVDRVTVCSHSRRGKKRSKKKGAKCLSAEEFEGRYVNKQPVLLDGLLEDWPALQHWSTVEGFVERHGSLEVGLMDSGEENVITTVLSLS